MAKEFSRKFMGYRRENGRVGVRNDVIIQPVDDISNAAAEAVNRKGPERILKQEDLIKYCKIEAVSMFDNPYQKIGFGA